MADDVKKLPQNMLGALSSRETQDLLKKKKPVADPEDRQLSVPQEDPKEDSLDEGETHWDTELVANSKEKQRLFSVLSQFVPQSEIFFNLQSQTKAALRKKEIENGQDGSASVKRHACQIKRFDPRNPAQFAIAPQSKEKKEKPLTLKQ